ncbi:MAG: 4Fe-4S binding protein [Firmicutes bacterium]|nr:4Fe-4S binding protein [Bacillota bacterium]
MKRKIVKINEEKCNGCGLCVSACREGALQIVEGKARLVSDSYCDGLGACLPECPTGAIQIEERDAAAFDETAVLERQRALHQQPEKIACGCPGTQARSLERGETAPPNQAQTAQALSELRQWPCQLQLVPVNAPYLENAHLLVAADCAAYAYANLHREFMRNKITLIGCPKLDDADYAGKLAEIIKQHQIKSVTVLRMEVPCCGGIVNAVKEALSRSGKMIPWSVTTISTDGKILED